MKKLLALVIISGMVTFVACGPSKKDIEAKEKLKQDSIAAVDKQRKQADSLAQVEKQKREADSLAQMDEENGNNPNGSNSKGPNQKNNNQKQAQTTQNQGPTYVVWERLSGGTVKMLYGSLYTGGTIKYFPNGNKELVGYFVNGRRSGTWTFYNKKGIVEKYRKY